MTSCRITLSKALVKSTKSRNSDACHAWARAVAVRTMCVAKSVPRLATAPNCVAGRCSLTVGPNASLTMPAKPFPAWSARRMP
eukprot:8722615-Pyramimonas_sp.AAC.1